MKAVKVQYTVQASYVATNKENVQRVMEALRNNPIEGMMYSTFTHGEDPNTFIHINIAKDAETMARLAELAEFKQFRAALKESKPVSPPQQTALNLVGAGFELS